jgi:hypothetical protein
MKYTTINELCEGIADSIRTKDGSTDKINPQDFPSRIENLSSGGGITIVDSVDQLDPNAELGSLASVVEQGSIKESSFRDLYQPDASVLDMELGVITSPELLSSVSSINVFTIEDSSIDIDLVESMLYLVPRDFSMTNQNMAMVQIMPFQGVMAMAMFNGDYDNTQQFVLAEYSQDTMSYISNDDQVEAFNTVLANGMDWCYFGCPDSEFVITEEQFDTIDLFLKAVAGAPSKAHIYLKKDKWEELYIKDLNRISNRIDAVGSNLNSLSESIYSEINFLNNKINKKPDKTPIVTSYSYSVLQPNEYTKRSISTTGQVAVELATSADTTIYNEYILELKCTSTPSSVIFRYADGSGKTIVWANDEAPTFEAGMTYLISIANGLAVYAMFPNYI